MSVMRIMPWGRKLKPKAYDPQRPGTSVLVDLVILRLLAEPLEDPRWAYKFWKHDVSKRVKVVRNEQEIPAFNKLQGQLKRTTDIAKRKSIICGMNNLGDWDYNLKERAQAIILKLDNKTIALTRAETKKLQEVAQDIEKRSRAWHEAQGEAQNQAVAVEAVADVLGVEALSS